MKSVRDIPDIRGAPVLLRADFDVPVDEHGHVHEEFRIVKQKENLDFLLSRGARVVMVAHISAVESFRPLLPQLKKFLGREIGFADDLTEVHRFVQDAGSLLLLDNIRKWPEEERNDSAFAGELAAGFAAYVNNAFAVCHREHASVATVPFMLPSFAGLLVQAEIAQLRKVMDAPAAGKVVIMGGAKASTKVPVIRHLIANADAVLTGGVIALDIAKVLGNDIGASRVDPDAAELLAGLDLNDQRLHIPEDSVTDNGRILDTGPLTAARYRDIIATASTVIWNGPMGVFEDERYMPGTRAIAEAIVAGSAFSLIGGGDTIAAVHQLGLMEKFSHVCTGGGAMLAFLANQQLPGLVPLGVYTE